MERELLGMVLAAKLRHVKVALRSWSREAFGDIFKSVKVAEQRAANAKLRYDADLSEANLVLFHEAQAQLRRSHGLEHMFWQQKTRVKWLKDGDRNSKYFHSVVAERRSKLIIHRIKASNGEWLRTACAIEGEAESFFRQLFTSEASVESFDTLDVIPNLITTQDNAMLEEIPSREEVRLVVFPWMGSVRLVRIVSRASQKGFLPFKVPSKCPTVTHLAYADGVIIFCSGVKCTLQRVLRVLEAYCNVSGQQLNLQKSCFIAHDALTQSWTRVISQVTGFQARSLLLKYLGCSLYSGRRRRCFFSGICTSVAKRIFSWKEKLLSPRGRLVLIKSVLSSLPIHILAASAPPKGVLSTLEKLFANFLWGSAETGSRYHWIGWDSLYKPFVEGGAGVRALADVLESFSLKLWWSFRQRKSLWYEFMHAKYLYNVHVCEAEYLPLQSIIWKRMVRCQGLVESHIQWVSQNGSVDFWHENWMGIGPLCQRVEIFGEHRVADFVLNGLWCTPMPR
ncbi:uncharacterized protein LOC113758125 [Coffea eugenioides]|uniref:uncharacterized protein LOC113757691 n=1 Tax=Coffea eugenioides TaxID=49369 RepID=UPI000F609354|nr:uncharacterized protein LOC113757691 [Coffea eugenioides]XP_027156936.1 uncharacterized protein LOC113758125 [Coffea eugenioides]